MTVFCKICRNAISAPAGNQPSVEEIMKQASMHLGTAHAGYMQEFGQALQTAFALFTTYLVFHYVNVPASESDLLEAHAKNKQAILDLLEFQPLPAGPKAAEVH